MGRFDDALARPGLGAIAEIKRRSPSAGDLRPGADPAVIAPAYAAAGAAAISVLVDERFGGTWDDLRAARAATTAPLLAKGFFSTDDQLRTAREAGADAVLLLLRDLDDAETARLMQVAAGLGLDTLVEAHDAGELDRGIALGAKVLGVNARDLSTFTIDRSAQLELVARIPADRIVIAESGIETRAQGAAAELAGADAVLVGSTLMRAADPAAKLAELPLAPARQGVRPDPRGGRRRGGRGRRRPRRLRARAREPARSRRRPTGARRDAVGGGLGRCGRREQRDRDPGRPRPGAHGGSGEGARPGGGAAPQRSAGRTRARPALGGHRSRSLACCSRGRRENRPRRPARPGQRAGGDRGRPPLGGRCRIVRSSPRPESRITTRYGDTWRQPAHDDHTEPTAPTAAGTCRRR